jgi:putative hemolysin
VNVKTALVLGAAITLGIAPLSCGDDSDVEEPGVPNPASVHCEERGGTVEIETSEDGSQVGYCVLPSGERIEEWELYRRDNDG